MIVIFGHELDELFEISKKLLLDMNNQLFNSKIIFIKSPRLNTAKIILCDNIIKIIDLSNTSK